MHKKIRQIKIIITTTTIVIIIIIIITWAKMSIVRKSKNTAIEKEVFEVNYCLYTQALFYYFF